MTEREAEVVVGNESNVIKIYPLENKFKQRVERYFDFLPEKAWQFC